MHVEFAGGPIEPRSVLTKRCLRTLIAFIFTARPWGSNQMGEAVSTCVHHKSNWTAPLFRSGLLIAESGRREPVEALAREPARVVAHASAGSRRATLEDRALGLFSSQET